MSLFTEIEKRAAVIAAVEASRNGVETLIYTIDTVGGGELLLKDPVLFDAPFVRRPFLHTGSSVKHGSLIDGKFPQISLGVSAWSVSKENFFIGAYLFVRVEENGTSYALTHDFAFTGQVVRRTLGQLAEDLT
ncbi:MAG: hypothetical protein ACXVYY_00875 [Oryzihumus sp.]